MSRIKDNKTHVSDLIGKYRKATTAPTDKGPAGIAAGDIYIDENDKRINVYTGSSWVSKVLTTTSTSTSTSTSTTTTA